MTETPPVDSGTETPPATDPGTTTTDPGTTPPADSGTVSQPGDSLGDPSPAPNEQISAQSAQQPQAGSTANLVVTEVMAASALPTPGGGTGGPITTVYGTKAPDVWATKGWAAASAGDKPNISNVGAIAEVQKVTNAGLSDAEATILDNPKTEAAWEPKGWVPDDTGGGTTATGATAGSPGSFTPSGATAPANLAAMSGITASPTTAWTTGESVTLGDASSAHWDGSAWQTGVAP